MLVADLHWPAPTDVPLIDFFSIVAALIPHLADVVPAVKQMMAEILLERLQLHIKEAEGTLTTEEAQLRTALLEVVDHPTDHEFY